MYYGDYQRELADKIRRGRVAGTLDGLREELREYLTQINIGTRKYHPFLQKLVVESALEPERLEAWLVELTGGEAAERTRPSA
jgi:truncated hemoglobin YjbI